MCHSHRARCILTEKAWGHACELGLNTKVGSFCNQVERSFVVKHLAKSADVQPVRSSPFWAFSRRKVDSRSLCEYYDLFGHSNQTRTSLMSEWNFVFLESPIFYLKNLFSSIQYHFPLKGLFFAPIQITFRAFLIEREKIKLGQFFSFF